MPTQCPPGAYRLHTECRPRSTDAHPRESVVNPANPWRRKNPRGFEDLAERLTAHRNDVNILAYAELGTLRVTWAAVSAAQQDGVERYLADQYPPLIGDAFPDVEPIAVNSPY